VDRRRAAGPERRPDLGRALAARARYPRKQAFRARSADGAAVALQTWPLAYWPDGSLKWTAHAVGAGELGARLTIEPGKPDAGAPACA
jgi:hypothetical protein